MNKKVIVTGSSGMLGTELVSDLQGSFAVTGIDQVKGRSPVRAVGFERCDITDRGQTVSVIKKVCPDIVIHTAAWTDVDGCELDKEKALRVNGEGTLNVALGARETNAVMIYVSTDFIFDGMGKDPYKEDDRPNPVNAYGLSKLKGEEAVRKTLDRYLILRTSWLFGKHGKNFVDIILAKAEEERELRVVMDQFGCPTYAKDLTEAILEMINLLTKNKTFAGTVHFCNGGSCTWFRYAEEILRLSGKSDRKIIPITSAELNRAAERPSMSMLSTEKYGSLTGNSPREWSGALKDYISGELGLKEYDVRNFKR